MAADHGFHALDLNLNLKLITLPNYGEISAPRLWLVRKQARQAETRKVRTSKRVTSL